GVGAETEVLGCVGVSLLHAVKPAHVRIERLSATRDRISKCSNFRRCPAARRSSACTKKNESRSQGSYTTRCAPATGTPAQERNRLKRDSRQGKAGAVPTQGRVEILGETRSTVN